jgi:hypothetical protein
MLCEARKHVLKMLTERIDFLTGNFICGIYRLIFYQEFFLFKLKEID